jgi:hypothetical protein
MNIILDPILLMNVAKFEPTWYLHLQHRKSFEQGPDVLQMAKEESVCPPSALWFLDRLILDPEDGGYTFFRNVGSHTDYTTLYSIR